MKSDILTSLLILASLSSGKRSLLLVEGDTSGSKINNPYISGCLYEKNLKLTKRICNSADPKDTDICHVPLVSYNPEIRLIAQDWTTAVFETWIIQIILSELLGVATTVETGSAGNDLNFYNNPSDGMRFQDELAGTSTYYYAAFDNAYRLKDCTLANRSPGEAYEPCGYFITESWGARKGRVQDYVYRGVLDPPQALGALGQEGWYIPKVTAEDDPSLLSYLGLQGEGNRHKLARRFKRPTTWKYYCDRFSSDNCATPDDVAKMAPRSEDDYHAMFVDGLYTGYFRETEKNDCNSNPSNCTGHFVDYPCQWSTPAVTQVHYLNIAVDGDGLQDNNLHSYSYSQMIQIWKAANATRSDVVMYWWSPSELIGEFANSDFEFVKIDMPTPTQECLDNRVGASDRCGDDQELRIGDPRSVCDEPPNSLHSLMSSTLYDSIHDSSTAEAAQSPAYDMLKNFRMTELQLQEMFLYLQESDGDAREAVCNWAATNSDYLFSFIPHTYPREYVEQEPSSPLVLTSYVLAGCTLACTILMIGFLFLQRRSPWFKRLELEFLSISVGGVLLVAINALVISVPQSGLTCTMSAWLVNIGYTMMLVPHIVTVHAVNTASRALVRRRIARSSLLRPFAACTSFIVGFLILWTMIDPPEAQREFQLLDDEQEEPLVAILAVCRSDSMAWSFASVGWVVLLLLITSVLAFQMSQVTLAKFDESPTLALLIYTHNFFALSRLVTYFLHESSGVSEYVLSRIRSIIFSADALGVLIIYFVPKLRKLMKPQKQRPSANKEEEEKQADDTMSAIDEVPILKAQIRFLEEKLTLSEIGGVEAVKSPFTAPMIPENPGSGYPGNNDAVMSSLPSSQNDFDDNSFAKNNKWDNDQCGGVLPEFTASSGSMSRPLVEKGVPATPGLEGTEIGKEGLSVPREQRKEEDKSEGRHDNPMTTKRLDFAISSLSLPESQFDDVEEATTSTQKSVYNQDDEDYGKTDTDSTPTLANSTASSSGSKRVHFKDQEEPRSNTNELKDEASNHRRHDSGVVDRTNPGFGRGLQPSVADNVSRSSFFTTSDSPIKAPKRRLSPRPFAESRKSLFEVSSA